MCKTVRSATVQCQKFTVVGKLTNSEFEYLLSLNHEAAFSIKHHIDKYQDMNMRFKEKLIRNSDLTYNLPDEIIRELAYGLKTNYRNTGSYLICSGERDRQIYFVFSGEVEVSIYCIGQ